MKHKFNIGDKVVYQGIIGVIENQSEYMDGRPSYGLVACEDSEMSCTADESICEPYNDGDEVDQDQALRDARFNSFKVMSLVDSVTDKYFRDGNH